MKILKKVFIVALLFLILFLGYKFIKNNKSYHEPVIETKIEKYGYELTSNKSSLYKKTFQELSNVLNNDEIDEKEYVSLISKLFIIDFYTLEDKSSNLDIGGMQFVCSDIEKNFRLKAKETLYKYVESNIYGDRKQSLPVVDDVSIENITQKEYNSKSHNDEKAFYVLIKWSYKKDLGYDTSKTLVFIHESNKLSLISID